MGPDQDEADDRFHELMLERRGNTAGAGSLAELLDRFYLYSTEEKKGSTARW